MKRKITIVTLLSLIFISFAPHAFAANVLVTGQVDNMDTKTQGSKIVFKDSASQNIILTQEIDPLGKYTVYIPQGKYDVTIVPPSQSGLSEITKPNQEFQSNTIANFSMPSSHPVSQAIQNNFDKVLFAALAVFVLLLGIGAGSFFLRKKK